MSEARNIMLVLEFDGTCYSGWQIQKNARSVSGAVAEAIRSITGEDSALTGCGRTDAGVHAFNYVCNFRTATRIPPSNICFALNTELPDDIVCKYSKEVGDDFHSRYSAVSKRYIYLIQNTPCRPAVYRNMHCHCPVKLDLERMKKAASHIVGEHDFRSFMASGGRITDTVRTVYELRVDRNDGVVEIDIRGNGFLYNMVRIIAGTLMDAGSGRIEPESVAGIISSRDRKKAGKTAPACGLYLAEVEYP